MALTKLQFRPGIVRDATDYSNEGGWRDCDKVRFRMGFPETIGGWQKLTSTTMQGTCRSLHAWSTLNGTTYLGAGTNLKFYAIEGTEPQDITPIRVTTSAGDVTFAATAGSTTITVTDADHGAYPNDFVTFSDAASLGGTVSAAVLNTEHQIVAVVDTNTYTIAVATAANASDTGNGGSATVGTYQINTGLDSVILGTGWGAGTWSRGTWGSSASTALPGEQLRLWSQDNFGEDLVFNVRGGGVYYWDASAGVGTRAVNVTSLSGATSVPTVANVVLVSERDRHVIAFGCDPEGAPGVQDPLTIRFSDSENIADWAATDINTAGELRLGTGTEIVAAVQTKQQVLVLTDVSAYVMQYVGAPFTFGITEVSTNISITGQNAVISTGDAAYWMGKGQFYMYNGNVAQIPCSVREYVFADLDPYQTAKVMAASNAAFSEIWWFYPSVNSPVNDKYVVYNYAENTWYYGTLSRTAWVDNAVSGYPVAASTDGYLYYHEYGIDDGSANPPAALNAYIESSGVDLGDGDQFMFATRLIPDLSFRSSSFTPKADFVVSAREYPGGAYVQSDTNTVTASIPITEYTNQVYVRLRGRAMAVRVESNQVGTAWRLGSPRVDIRPDGRR